MNDRNAIITLPHPSLRKKSKKVGVITKDVQNIIDNMTTIGLDWEDHHDHEVTVGLAAVQINILEKIIIIRSDFDNKTNRDFQALINPELVKTDGTPLYELEGCLSVAGYYGRVKRYPTIRIKALSESGKPVKMTAHGFLARLLQHEIDHINGRTYLDRLDENGELYRMLENGKLELLTDEEYEAVLQELQG
jgi:peptide deformylase